MISFWIHLWGLKTGNDILLGRAEVYNTCKNSEKNAGKGHRMEKNVFACIKQIWEIQLRWFQTKICYIILVTNSVLKDTGVLENNICNFCLTEKDSFPLSVPLWTHPVLLDQVWGTFEREEFLC